MNSQITDNDIYLGYEISEVNFERFHNALADPWEITNFVNIYSGHRHIISIGPNGSGKSRKLLIPNLYRLKKWSTLVIDPKGELAVLTAKQRNDSGSEIVTFDPFGVIESRYPGLVKELPYLKSRGFNPLAMLDPEKDDFHDDAKALSEALIKDEGPDTHWVSSAQSLITGLIMALRMTLGADDSEGSLVGLRELLSMKPDNLSKCISDLINGTLSEPVVSAKLNRFLAINPDSKELLSILSTAVTQTDWIDSKPIRREISSGTFDFSEMKRRPITVYLILPPRYLETHAIWLRMMITAVLTPLIRSTAAGVPVMLMLDEFAALGHLEVIERNMALMRGYGIKLWVVLQDLSQLKSCYEKRWESFIANAGLIQSFAPQDMMTRRYLSQLSGQQLISVKSSSNASGSTSNYYNWSESKNSTSSVNISRVLENVYPEDELAQMSETHSVLFEAQRAPRRTLLPDPSELLLFQTSENLSLAAAYAAQHEVDELNDKEQLCAKQNMPDSEI